MRDIYPRGAHPALPASGSDNTIATKEEGKGDRDTEKGLVDEQRDEEQDYRVNRVVLVVTRLSARLYDPLLPVYVLFMPLTILVRSTSSAELLGQLLRIYRFVRESQVFLLKLTLACLCLIVVVICMKY